MCVLLATELLRSCLPRARFSEVKQCVPAPARQSYLSSACSHTRRLCRKNRGRPAVGVGGSAPGGPSAPSSPSPATPSLSLTLAPGSRLFFSTTFLWIIWVPKITPELSPRREVWLSCLTFSFPPVTRWRRPGFLSRRRRRYLGPEPFPEPPLFAQDTMLTPKTTRPLWSRRRCQTSAHSLPSQASRARRGGGRP